MDLEKRMSVCATERSEGRPAKRPERRPSDHGAAARWSLAHPGRGVERCLSVKQVAVLLGYSAKQVRRLCRQGTIRTVHYSARAQYRIPLSALREFLSRDQSYWATRSKADFDRELAVACDPAESPKRNDQE